MYSFPEPIARLTDQFARLPGIGPKSAQRLAFHAMSMKDEDISQLIDALLRIKRDLMLCETCCAITDTATCTICGDPERDYSTICVVADTRDVMALERMQTYRGLYHVLGGLISPMDGMGPDQLHIKELLERVADERVKELIIATSSTLEGEGTAMYIARLVRTFDRLAVTRIAHGLPVGGDLEYADEMTLSRALEYRRPIAY